MADIPILAQLPLLPEDRWPPKKAENKPNLHTYWQQFHRLPAGAGDNPTIQRYLDLLGPLDWGNFPERDLERDWGQPQIPYAALAAAELIRLEQGLRSAADLNVCLREHPGFIPLLGFPLVPAPNQPLGFNARASLPTPRHVNRLLRRMPNAAARFLLADTVRLILAELAARQLPPPQCISLDTKHILAWVKENNRKAYVKERYNKTRQPAGDPDCRLGCKRRRNQGPPDGTPTRNPVPAAGRKVGEFYWGYVWIRGTAAQVADRFRAEDPVRGELTVVVEGFRGDPGEAEAERLDSLIRGLAEAGVSPGVIRDVLAPVYDRPRREIYQRALGHRKA